MTDPQPARRRTLVAWLAGLALLAAYAALVQWLLGWQALAASLLAAGWAPLMLVLAGQLGSYALRALRIRAAEPSVPRDDLPGLLRLFTLYNLSNWLLPARLGEASLPLLLQRRYGLPLARGGGLLLWLRLLDLHVIAVLAGAVLLGLDGHWRGLGVVLLPAGLALPWLSLHGLSRLSARWPKLAALSAVLPSQLPTAAVDLALAWAAWTWKLACLGAALALLAGLSYPAAILGALGGDISAVLPLHAPLGAGSYEAGVLLALAPWQPGLKPALAAAIHLHALLLSAALLLGTLSLPALRRRATVVS